MIMPIENEIRHSDAVFSGKVQSIDKDVTTAGGGFPPFPPGRVTLDVQDSWKGVSTESVSIDGQGDGINCHTMFEEDETYLVYASRKGEDADAPLQNNACAATKPLEYAKADLRVLGSPPDDLPETGGPALPVLLEASAAVILTLLTLASVLVVCGRDRA